MSPLPPPPPPSITRTVGTPARTPRTEPVTAPAGYRWHLDVEGLRWVRSNGRKSIGDLELIGVDDVVGTLGSLWRREPVPGKKRKTRLVPTFARCSDPLYSSTAMRRVSRRLVRKHEALLAEERERARERHLAAAAIANLPTGPTPPGGVSQPRGGRR
jgi:hypothetical protein